MEMTAAQIAEQKKMISKIIQHNGNVAYRVFTGNNPPGPVQVVSITAPINEIPKAVGFIDKSLIGRESANDAVNPDGSFPKALTPIAKAKAKRPGLRLVK
jgi:hypothetical protein